MAKELKGRNSRYAPIWNKLKFQALAPTNKSGVGRVLVELFMAPSTFRKALSRQKLEDTAFGRAFPNAKLQMEYQEVGNVKRMLVILHTNPQLTLSLFEEPSNE